MTFDLSLNTFLEQYGVLSVLVLVFLEYTNLPIPSEIVLPIVGMLIVAGKISLFEGIIYSIIAGLIGSLLMYYIGFYIGNPLISFLIKKSPSMRNMVDSNMYWVNRYGNLSVMIARIIPLGRTFISIPAGIVKMNLPSFLSFSAIGIGIWNTALILLGMLFGHNISGIMEFLKDNLILLIFGLAVIIGFCVFLKIKRKGSKNNKEVTYVSEV